MRKALASGKVVYSNVSTEVSRTAKVCTDEQKLDKRHSREDKVAHHTKVRRKQKSLRCRFSRHKPKAIYLTEGDPTQAVM